LHNKLQQDDKKDEDYYLKLMISTMADFD